MPKHRYSDKPPRPKKKVKTSRPRGSKKAAAITVAQLEEITRLASTGCTQKNLAFLLDVHSATIERWIKSEERFSRAYRKGRALMEQGVVAALMKAALKSGNVTAMIWLTKTQFNWVEARPEDTGAGDEAADAGSIAKRVLSSAPAFLATMIGGPPVAQPDDDSKPKLSIVTKNDESNEPKNGNVTGDEQRNESHGNGNGTGQGKTG